MRINTATLDPSSPLARRIAAAEARDAMQVFPAPGSMENRHPDAGVSGTQAAREYDLHLEVVALLRACGPGVFWTHFPAGEKRSEATGKKLARMGLLPGVPDFLVVIGGRALFLELKTGKGTLSGAQKKAHAALIRAGADVRVVRSADDARRFLAEWSSN